MPLEDITNNVSNTLNCLVPVNIIILVDAGVPTRVRIKLEQSAVQLMAPYKDQKIKFEYVGNVKQKLKFSANQNLNMIDYQNLLGEIRKMRKELNEVSFDNAKAVQESESLAISEQKSSNQINFIVALFTTSQRLQQIIELNDHEKQRIMSQSRSIGSLGLSEENMYPVFVTSENSESLNSFNQIESKLKETSSFKNSKIIKAELDSLIEKTREYSIQQCPFIEQANQANQLSNAACSNQVQSVSTLKSDINLVPICNLESGLDLAFFIETSFNSKPYHLMFYKHMIITVLKKFSFMHMVTPGQNKFRVITYASRGGRLRFEEIWKSEEEGISVKNIENESYWGRILDNLEIIIQNPKNINDMPLNVASAMEQIRQHTTKKSMKNSLNIILHGPRSLILLSIIIYDSYTVKVL